MRKTFEYINKPFLNPFHKHHIQIYLEKKIYIDKTQAHKLLKMGSLKTVKIIILLILLGLITQVGFLKSMAKYIWDSIKILKCEIYLKKNK